MENKNISNRWQSNKDNKALQSLPLRIIPKKIPFGARIVVREFAGIDEHTGRQAFQDKVGHVLQYTKQELVLERDASANGKRKSEIAVIPVKNIAIIKPVPERPTVVKRKVSNQG